MRLSTRPRRQCWLSCAGRQARAREPPRVGAKARNPGSGTTKRQTEETTPRFAQHLSRSVSDIGLLHLPRLAFSRREADAIMALTPAGEGMEAVGFDASRSTAI